MKPFAPLAALVLSLAAVASAAPQQPPQQPRVYTDADYAQAEKFMPYNVNPLVLHAVENPVWTADGRVWYRDNGAQGTAFLIVDPVKKTRGRAFDQAKMAAALKPFARNGADVDANHLPVQSFALTNNDQTVLVTAFGRRLVCDLSGAGVCTAPDQPAGAPAGRRRRATGGVDYSPDGTRAVFIRDWNLWVRDLATNQETQLTTDGIPNYGYATDNAGWTHSDNPIVVWSPDSKQIATFQQDQRKTGELYLVPTVLGHPTLTTLKYPLVGDKDVTMIERVVIDLPTAPGAPAKIVRLKMPPDQHRSTLCDDISCRGGSGWDDVQWSADSKSLAFVSTSRDHKQEWMRIANPVTGDVRDVMGETVKKFYESGNDKVNWHYLAATHELLWFPSAITGGISTSTTPTPAS